MQALSLDPTQVTDQRNQENDWFFEIFDPEDDEVLVDCE